MEVSDNRVVKDPADPFAWINTLECPKNAWNPWMKKILRKGIGELLWDDIAKATLPAKDVLTVRKNILLHKLKQGRPDKSIECVRNIQQIKSKRNDLAKEISRLEDEYEKQEFAVKRKVNTLENIRSARSLVKVKKDMIKMKHSQTATQLADCNSVRLICKQLMQSTGKNLDPNKMREMLDTVVSLGLGANKKQVWDTITSAIGSIEVPTLWNNLYQNLSQDVDRIIKLKSENTTNAKALEGQINVNLSKMYGQHVCMVSKRLLHEARAKNLQESALEFIEKIEAASEHNPDVSEWLALVLEIRKLEVEETSLQNEIDKIQSALHENDTVVLDLCQLTSEIQDIDSEIEEYVRDVQQSLIFLKSAPKVIMQIKEKILLELQKIVAIRADDYDCTWLNDELTTELDIFHEGFDISALRKIILKGDVRTYRHTKCCLSDACVSVTMSQTPNLMAYFPMIQTPICSLIECYKNLVTMLTYKKLESSPVSKDSDYPEVPILIVQADEYNTVELLSSSEIVSDKTKKEIAEINKILNIWLDQQPLEKMMGIVEKTVDGVSFSDWLERYSILLYTIQNNT